ncbi:hypothetical protein RS3R2_39750 [Pseudomonas lactis]|nr:hypothetical protein RS3R2_39750 [Pseudomonas lactis]
MLNLHGYHRIAPVGSFEELLAIINSATEPFDLVVINTALVHEAAICVETFCLQCPYIRNALIYEGRPEFLVINDEQKPAGVFTRLSGVPDTRAIENLMSQIDPRRKKAAYRACFS